MGVQVGAKVGKYGKSTEFPVLPYFYPYFTLLSYLGPYLHPTFFLGGVQNPTSAAIEFSGGFGQS